MSRPLDKAVRSFRLFGVDHMNIVVWDDLFLMAFYPISIKYKDQIAFPESLIIAHNILQLLSGSRHTDFCKLT